MRKEKVIIKELSITKKGEQKFFEIRVPRDAGKIIGFETTVKGFDFFMDHHHHYFNIFFFKPSYPAGQLKIQSCGCANLFYSTEVTLSDINLGFGDFSIPFFYFFFPFDFFNYWRDSAWTHGHKREEDSIRINKNCPVLYGNYKDRIGEIWGGDIPYKVTVYVWYESKTVKNDNQSCT